jgi:hypothetical protein
MCFNAEVNIMNRNDSPGRRAQPSRAKGWTGLICAVFFWLAIAPTTFSQVQAADLELEVSLSDTTVIAGDTSAWITVSLANYQDTLAGFTMRILLDRPDIIEFRTDETDTLIDTIDFLCIQWDNGVCIDSIPIDPPIIDTFFLSGIDTAGSFVSNWELVVARSLSPDRHDIKITGLADGNPGPPLTPGLPPQPEPVVLCRLKIRVYESLPAIPDSIVNLFIVTNLSETNFADPYGFLIGTTTNINICDSCYCETWDEMGDSCLTACLDTPPGGPYDTLVVDTFYRYWICQEWGQDSQGQDSCLSWSYYTNPDSAANADSISIDSIPWTVWNDSTVVFDNGRLQVVAVTCGDANQDQEISIADAVFLISYVFKGGPAPVPEYAGDANGDGDVNIADAVYLISYVFKGGPEPVCP